MSPQLNPLTIDADQWRRDIKTFAEATNQALEGIIAQLSSSCSAGPANQDLDRRGDAATLEMKTLAEPKSASGGSQGDLRLSELKRQLAQRISRTS